MLSSVAHLLQLDPKSMLTLDGFLTGSPWPHQWLRLGLKDWKEPLSKCSFNTLLDSCPQLENLHVPNLNHILKSCRLSIFRADLNWNLNIFHWQPQWLFLVGIQLQLSSWRRHPMVLCSTQRELGLAEWPGKWQRAVPDWWLWNYVRGVFVEQHRLQWEQNEFMVNVSAID